eukprot:sb/3464775/
MGESLVLPPEVYPLYCEKEFIPADTEESGIPNVSIMVTMVTQVVTMVTQVVTMVAQVVYPLYCEKEFIPADTEESGIPNDVRNGYVAKEEYTTHTLSKKYKGILRDLNKIDAETTKNDKSLLSLRTLLQSYQTNPSYGSASEVEIQMSGLRQEMRIQDMYKAGLTSQLTLLEDSGIQGSGSVPSDPEEDTRSLCSTATVDVGEHDWTQLGMTEMKSCDHCQKPTMLFKSYQCIKCKVYCHSTCKSKVFDCVGEMFTQDTRRLERQDSNESIISSTSRFDKVVKIVNILYFFQPLVEQTADKVSKIKNSIMKGAGGILKRAVDATGKRMSGTPGAETRPMDGGGGDETLSREWWTIKRGDADKRGGDDGPPANLEQWANAPDKGGNIPDKDRTLSGEWWTLKPGDAPAPRFGGDDVSEDEEDDVYDNVDDLKMISSSSSE